MLIQLEDQVNVTQEKNQSIPLAVGIDLGTTNSLVCWVEPESQNVMHLTKITPSTVAFDQSGNICVGHTNLDTVLSSTKVFLGSDTHTFDTPDGQKMTPVSVATEILKHLRHQAEQKLNKQIEAAVITVPAYFNEGQRQLTKHAAECAGLKVLRLVSEPTAAALAYGLDSEEKATNLEGLYVVFDLGGGTFDLSLLKLYRGVFQVLATSGDTRLGGDDFDRAIVNFIEKTLSQEFYDFKGALFQARSVREKLSQKSEQTFSYEGIQFQITQSVLKELSVPLLEQIKRCCDDILDVCNRQNSVLKGLILVGGATRMPMIQELAENYFKRPALNDLDPERIVAHGAARQAHALTHGSDSLLMDITPLSLGLELMGGIVDKIIERNTPIPCHIAKEFTTFKENQTGIVIHVVQGEREMVRDCQSLARFEIGGIPPMSAGVARITVSFKIDADGLLTVAAQEKKTNTYQEIIVKPSYGLKDSEMREMIMDSLDHAEEDFTSRKLAEAQTNARRLIEVILPKLSENRQLLSDCEYQKILDLLDELDDSLLSHSPDKIVEATTALEKGTQSFASKRMTHDLKKAIAGHKLDDIEKSVSMKPNL